MNPRRLRFIDVLPIRNLDRAGPAVIQWFGNRPDRERFLAGQKKLPL